MLGSEAEKEWAKDRELPDYNKITFKDIQSKPFEEVYGFVSLPHTACLRCGVRLHQGRAEWCARRDLVLFSSYVILLTRVLGTLRLWGIS